MGTKAFDNYADLITFTRASGGTALRPVSYGAELVTNGNDFSSGWSGVGWTFPSGQASVTGNGTNQNLYGTPVSNAVAGKLYQLSYEVVSSSLVGGAFRAGAYSGASFFGASFFTLSTSVGTHTLNFVGNPSGAGSVIDFVITSGVTSGTLVIDNISVKEVLFDQPDGTLTLFNHPNNIPRIEYDADGNRLGLLIEEQRTNLISNSDVKDWNTGYYISNTDQTAPSLGFLFGAEIVSGGFDWHRAFRTLSVTLGTTYAITAFIKAGIGGKALINLRDVAGAQETRVAGSIGSLGVTISLAGNASSVTETLIGDVTKVTFVYTPDFSGTLEIGIGPYSTNSGDSIIGLGAQIEQGSFPTSYIPTSGSTATRAADVASIPVADFGYNQKQGTLFLEYVPKAVTSDIRAAFDLTEEAGSTDNRVYHSASTGTHWLVRSGGSLQAALDAGTTTANQTNKVAGVYKVNDFAVTIDGGTVATDTNGSVPVSIGRLFIGKLYNGYEINGHIKSIKYYPRRLTNAQLVEITS